MKWNKSIYNINIMNSNTNKLWINNIQYVINNSDFYNWDAKITPRLFM